MLDHRRALSVLTLAGALVTTNAARAQAPAGRYVLGNDNYNTGGPDIATVYDTKTKLTWQQVPMGPFPVGAKPTNPLGACASLTEDTGVVGWRLPTTKELYTLVDFAGDHGPYAMIDQQFFPNTPSDSFLSATSSAANPVQCVYFGQKFYSLSCGAQAYTRCVR